VSPVPATRTLRYGKDAQQTADVTLPKGPVKGTMMFVHGGAWRGGAGGDPLKYQSQYAQAAKDAAARGWASVSVGYRTPQTGAAIGPALADIMAANRWVQQHKGAWGIKGRPTVLAGDSAGGHLAMLAASRGAGNAVVNWGGPTNLQKWKYDVVPGYDWIGGVVGSPDRADPRYAAFSPALQAKRLARLPVRMVGSVDDPYVNWRGQGLAAAGAIRRAGGNVNVKAYPGAAHTPAGLDIGATLDWAERSVPVAPRRR
jgi:acetyl esterase/lipase